MRIEVPAVVFIIAVLLVLGPPKLHAQGKVVQFFELSKYEKVWTVKHLKHAAKANYITELAKTVTDSLIKNNVLDQDLSGGQIDAFRHAFWMGAMVLNGVPPEVALELGEVHEKSNISEYKARSANNLSMLDASSCYMDLFNNIKGIELALSMPKNCTTQQLIHCILTRVALGDFAIIYKDYSGNMLTCEGEILSIEEQSSSWYNGKCVVPSNQIKNRVDHK